MNRVELKPESLSYLMSNRVKKSVTVIHNWIEIITVSLWIIGVVVLIGIMWLMLLILLAAFPLLFYHEFGIIGLFVALFCYVLGIIWGIGGKVDG